MIHLYKLVTGETVIAGFSCVTVINEKRNLTAHVVTNPLIVDKEWYFPQWFAGLVTTETSHIPTTAIILVAEEHQIDPVLIEEYLTELKHQSDK
jgi:hypothetical protein